MEACNEENKMEDQDARRTAKNMQRGKKNSSKERIGTRIAEKQRKKKFLQGIKER